MDECALMLAAALRNRLPTTDEIAAMPDFQEPGPLAEVPALWVHLMIGIVEDYQRRIAELEAATPIVSASSGPSLIEEWLAQLPSMEDVERGRVSIHQRVSVPCYQLVAHLYQAAGCMLHRNELRERLDRFEQAVTMAGPAGEA